MRDAEVRVEPTPIRRDAETRVDIGRLRTGPSRRATLTLLACLVGGCLPTQQAGRVSLVSTEPYPRDATVLAPRVEGTSCVDYGLFGSDADLPDLSLAVEDALAGTPGADSLLDASVSLESRAALVFHRLCFRVVGDAVRIEP